MAKTGKETQARFGRVGTDGRARAHTCELDSSGPTPASAPHRPASILEKTVSDRRTLRDGLTHTALRWSRPRRGESREVARAPLRIRPSYSPAR
jgi:hypothetical protein